jgi:positive regulator of sigma E activity
MTERIAKVLQTFDNHTAEVLAEKNTACGGCKDTHNCEICLSGNSKIIAVVQNDAGAGPGDVVEIRQKRNALLGSAAVFYGVPVLLMMAGALTGSAMASGWNIGDSLGAVLAAMAGLAVGLLAVFWFSRTEFARTHLVPHIVAIIRNESNGHPRTALGGAARQSDRPCCG